jgi:hypothetical protein
MPNLDKRVQRLENIVWVATIVAAIFGLSGAYGYAILLTAKKDIVDLKGSVTKVKEARDQAIRDVRASAPEALKSAMAEAGTTLSTDTDGDDGRGCEILGNRQLCWGSKEIRPDAKGEIQLEFEFKKPFNGKPIVTASVKNHSLSNTAAGYAVLGVIAFSEKNTKINFSTFSSFNPTAPMEATASYIAVGAPQTK